MAASLPPGCVAIYTAKGGKPGECSVMGVVVDALPPKRSGGTSFVSTFTLKDCDFDTESWLGLKVRCFNDHESSLLRPDLGDVVLLRKMRVSRVSFFPGCNVILQCHCFSSRVLTEPKMREFYGTVLGTIPQSDQSVSWTMFRADPRDPSGVAIIHTSGQRSPPSDAEKASALSLFNHPNTRTVDASLAPRRQSVGSVVPSASVVQSAGTAASIRPSTGRTTKFSLIRDLQYGKFADIVGQVVKTFYEDGRRYILYVTDYTANGELFNYDLDDDTDGHGRDGDEFSYIARGPKSRKWPGPFGRMTIQITLWDPHAMYADEHVKEDDFVQLNNVQIKPGKNAMMEGALRTDRVNPDKILVSVIDVNDRDERAKEVVRRKIDYWKGMKGKMKRVEGGSSDKRRLSDAEEPSGKKSRNQRRKERQKQRQREHQERQRQRTDPDQPKLGPSLVKRDQLNPHSRFFSVPSSGLFIFLHVLCKE